MGRFQAKAHPRWLKTSWDRTWSYIIMCVIALAVIIILLKI